MKKYYWIITIASFILGCIILNNYLPDKKKNMDKKITQNSVQLHFHIKELILDKNKKVPQRMRIIVTLLNKSTKIYQFYHPNWSMGTDLWSISLQDRNGSKVYIRRNPLYAGEFTARPITILAGESKSIEIDLGDGTWSWPRPYLDSLAAPLAESLSKVQYNVEYNGILYNDVVYWPGWEEEIIDSKKYPYKEWDSPSYDSYYKEYSFPYHGHLQSDYQSVPIPKISDTR